MRGESICRQSLHLGYGIFIYNLTTESLKAGVWLIDDNITFQRTTMLRICLADMALVLRWFMSLWSTRALIISKNSEPSKDKLVTISVYWYETAGNSRHGPGFQARLAQNCNYVLFRHVRNGAEASWQRKCYLMHTFKMSETCGDGGDA